MSPLPARTTMAITHPIRIAGAALLTAALLAPSLSAQNNGLYVPRTEHMEGNLSKALSQEGGFVSLRLPDGTNAVSFWLKWDRAADTQTNDAEVDRGGEHWFAAVRQVGVHQRWYGIDRRFMLPEDSEWHYHLFTFTQSNGSLTWRHFLDGSATKTFERTGGPTGERYLYLGADVELEDASSETNQYKRSTDINFILDDVTVWSDAGQSVFDNFSDVAAFGMTAFDVEDAGIVHYYSCNTERTVPRMSADYNFEPPFITGTSPSLSWYNYSAPSNGLILQDTSEVRKRKIAVTVTSEYGPERVSPPAGTSIEDYDGTTQTFIDFSAPEFIYLDRYGVELGSSDDENIADFMDQAYYRARNLGYAVRHGGRLDASGTALFFSQPKTENIEVSWKWELEHAVIIDSATGAYEGLNDALGNLTMSADGVAQGITTGRQWVPAGTSVKAAIDGIVFAEGEGDRRDVSFRSTGYTIENVAEDSGGARFLTLSNGSDHLVAEDAGISFGDSKSFTLEFWARRDGTDIGTGGAVAGIGESGMWVGYNFDDVLVFQSGGAAVMRLSTVDLGQEWHHWAWQYDEDATTTNVFIDGVLVASQKNVDPANWDFSSVDTVVVGGRLNDSGAFNLPFAGDIDQFRLWSRALSADEIAASMNTAAYGAQPDLALELTFDNADEVLETTYAANFPDNQALMTLDKPLTLPDACTLEALIYLPFETAEPPDIGLRAPFELSTGLSDVSFPIAIADVDQPDFGISAGDLGAVYSDGGVPVGFNVGDLDEGWHRFSVVLEGEQQTHYVDGALVGTVNLLSSRWLNIIGSIGFGSGTQVGWIDDVRVWSVARTAAQIASDWSHALQDTPSGLTAYYTFDDPANPGANVLGTGHNGTLESGATTGTPTGLPVGLPVMVSTEGNEVAFFFDGLDSVFANSVTVDPGDIVAVREVLFPYSEPSPQTTTARVTTDSHVVDDWMRITWNWKRNYRLQVEVADKQFAGLPFIQTERQTYVGTDSMGNIWVPELSAVTVGTIYRTSDRCFTLDAGNGVSGQQGAFRAVTMDTLVDGTFGGQVTRQLTFPAITGPGSLTLTFSDTVFRAEVAIGSGIDATTSESAAAALVPNLCGDSPLLSPDGPSDVLPPQAGRDGIISGDPWVWDAVEQVFYPLMPGTFTLTWPDEDPATATSYLIEIVAAFPTETVTIENRENEDGSRQDAPDYVSQVVFESVGDAFPGSPGAHYPYLHAVDADRSPPVALDPDEADRWFFHRTAYAENTGMMTDANAKTFTSTAPGRAVLLFSHRPDPDEAANGDTTKEAYTPRVILASPRSEHLQDESALSLPGGERRCVRISSEFARYGQINSNGFFFNIGSNASRSWDGWVRAHAVGNAVDADRIIFQLDVRNQQIALEFGLRSPTHATNPGGYFLEVKAYEGGDASGDMAIGLTNILVDESWHHWALVSDAAGLRIFQDGVLVGEHLGNPFTFAAESSNNVHTYGYSTREPDSWLEGDLDLVRYWGGALSATEIRSILRARPNDQSSLQPNYSYSFDNGINGAQILADDDLSYPVGSKFVVFNEDGSFVESGSVIQFAEEADFHPEVANLILSKLDTAGFDSGYIVNRVSNYNPRIYQRTAASGQWGPIYPVNWGGRFTSDLQKLEVVYYQNPYLVMPDSEAVLHPDVAWPYVAVSYDSVTFPEKGEHKDKRTYIASRLGSEGVDANGDDQGVYDPALFANLEVYHQPDRSLPGYNPNEEHALVAASIKHLLTGNPDFDLGQDAAFALQDGLNRTDTSDPAGYTSDPWVLVEFDDLETGEPGMAAYKVEKTRSGTALFPALDEDTHLPTDALGQPVAQPSDPTYDFEYPSFAGDLVSAPYPLNFAVGNVVMEEDVGADSRLVDAADPGLGFRRTVWFDKNGIAWIVSGDSGFVYRFWYPMRDDFWTEVGSATFETGDPIPWLPTSWNDLVGDNRDAMEPETVRFDTYWKENYPILKRGETMTYVGGENKADNPLATGLPGIVGWQSAQVVYDSRTPSMWFDELTDFVTYSGRVIRPLDAYRAPFEQALFGTILNGEGEPLTPASQDRVHVVGTRWYFTELIGSLQKRLYFDSLLGELVFRGRLNDLESGDSDLTKTPISLYLLESNVMSAEAFEAIKELGNGNAEWDEAVESLFLFSQNPAEVEESGDNPADAEDPVYLSGIGTGPAEQRVATFSSGTWTITTNTDSEALVPLDSLGTGAALVPNPTILSEEADSPLYLTLVENNNAKVAGAVTLHIIEIGEERFRGAIKLVEAQNVFDEKVNLRHSADFGGNTAETYYQWWIRDVDSLDTIALPGEEVAWQLYEQGLGLNQIAFTGRPDVVISDKFFYVRYGEVEELRAADASNNIPTDGGTPAVSAASWRLVDPNAFDYSYVKMEGDPVPFQWAGAFNSPQLQADGSRRFIPQLVMGWVKRVLDRVNPYEARFSETFSGDAPATFSSMIQQAGRPFIGAVALNADRDVLENVGLIELYETVLQRARELTIESVNGSTSGTNQALLLAATRLAVLYELLASEAYADGKNPSLPVTDENGLPVPGENGLATANPFVHAFQNQTASLLHEELALLRGTDFLKAYPAYNRLFWNYVKGLGEAAYNINYRITDITEDGIINEFDAAELYPQGHGDAWGHYLSANKMHYALLRHPAFDWEARAELYALLDNVIPTDYLDEESFARMAAAKARAGNEITSATYRLAYTADPDGQWQGYTDSADPARAWGVSEWSKRAGQGALFDWMVGNAILPAEADPDAENLDRLDRISNKLELGEIAGAIASIQSTLDNANTGTNPLGFNEDALVFDTDPFYDGQVWERRTHFEQIYDRAVAASQNALTALAMASRADLQLHRTAQDTRELQIDALQQDFDYRARLIEIYGTPYQGTMGPGEIYEEGYAGPDTLLYMYIDRTDLEELTPPQDPRFVTLQAGLKSLSKGWSAIDDGLTPRISPNGFEPEDVRSLFEDFYISREFAELELLPEGETPESEEIVSINVPVLETSAFAFQADETWGTRGAYGEIQILLNEMLAAEHEMDLEVESYADYVKDMTILHDRVRFSLRALRSKVENRLTADTTIPTLEGVGFAAEAAAGYLENIAEDAFRTASILASAFPRIVGLSSDPSSAARSAALGIGGGLTEAAEEIVTALKLIKSGVEISVSTIERLAESDQERYEDYAELLELLSEFGAELNEEPLMRNRITSKIQQMEILARQLRALEAEGSRLQNERAAFNMVLASKAQRNRYKDMATRLTRNDALGRYESAFENAQRYVWLAAKAYDYETSLDPGSPAAATSSFERIVKARQLGLWDGGAPQTGNGGLAEILAEMMANFGVLRGQLGINNPQYETGQLSLRREHFRILTGSSSSDTRWQQALLGARVDNLWEVPEFRRYCRPFAAESTGAQPGLVIDFATSINPGENVFGRPLAGGDNAYSNANYATKIAAVGTWFEGYNGTSLSTTPRVYLVPVGSDVLRVADSDEPAIRSWDVVEQRIPVPYLINSENMRQPGFIPSIHSLDGSFDEIKRFGDYRAYHTDGGLSFDTSNLTTDSRLIGRSVWNTRWLLVIPGATLSADPEAGLDAFIDGVSDIKLFFETYSNPGI